MEPGNLIIGGVQNLSSGDPLEVIKHLREGKENQRIRLLQGAWADIGDMFDNAANHRKKYSIQHLVVAPWEDMTREQMMTVALPLIAAKFNFPVCEAVVVEHQKDRADPNASNTHWHIVVAHFDPTTGKVRDWWQSHFKHELLARLLEYRFNHAPVCGFYHDSVLNALRKEAIAHPDADFGAAADRLEAAYPRGSRPDGKTTSKAAIKMHESVGRDLVALKKACRAAWSASSDLDQFNAALAKLGLYAQLAPNPPPNWAIYDDDGMIGTVAGMAKAKKADVIAKLGDPTDDDWYGTYTIELDPTLEPAADDHVAGADPVRGASPDGAAAPLHRLADPADGHDNAEAERVFEAEMNAMPAARFEYCERVAAYLTRPAWQVAMEYFNEKAEKARAYLDHGAARDLPAISALLTWVRDRAAELMAKLDTARNAWFRTTKREKLAHLHKKPAADIKAAEEANTLKKQEWETALQAVKDYQREVDIHEGFYLKKVAEHRASIVAKKIDHANRYLRVAERCKALVTDARAANVVGFIHPEVMFEMAYEADKAAKPGARWKIAGPPDESPDFDHPEPAGPKPP